MKRISQYFKFKLYCALLWEMMNNNVLTVEKLDNFLRNVHVNEYITISRCKKETGISEKDLADIFTKLYREDYLDISYAIKCPECGHLIKQISESELHEDVCLNYCYSCDKDISITDKDIVILFSKKPKSPFGKGQHRAGIKSIKSQDVAPMDSLSELKKISSLFEENLKIQNLKLKQDQKDKEHAKLVAKAKRQAYGIFLKRNKTYRSLKAVSMVISVGILIFILCITRVEGGASIIISVVIYIAQNVIDSLLSLFVKRELSDIEYQELSKINIA